MSLWVFLAMWWGVAAPICAFALGRLFGVIANDMPKQRAIVASEADHCAEDIRAQGRPFPEVHQLLDQFAHYPDMKFLRFHRKFLHHRQGIEYVAKRWGEAAGRSATLHIITDCGHVPEMADYHTGMVDSYGVSLVSTRCHGPEPHTCNGGPPLACACRCHRAGNMPK